VLCGEGIYEWQPAIEAAFNLLLKHPEYPMIVANPDSYWPNASTGKLGIGAGAQARFIIGILAEMKINIELIQLGKPHPAIYLYAVRALREKFGLTDLKKEEVLMALPLPC
jgi:ribonucleotide monophosphatase NagD (HAD superfamily)